MSRAYVRGHDRHIHVGRVLRVKAQCLERTRSRFSRLSRSGRRVLTASSTAPSERAHCARGRSTPWEYRAPVSFARCRAGSIRSRYRRASAAPADIVEYRDSMGTARARGIRIVALADHSHRTVCDHARAHGVYMFLYVLYVCMCVCAYMGAHRS